MHTLILCVSWRSYFWKPRTCKKLLCRSQYSDFHCDSIWIWPVVMCKPKLNSQMNILKSNLVPFYYYFLLGVDMKWKWEWTAVRICETSCQSSLKILPHPHDSLLLSFTKENETKLEELCPLTSKQKSVRDSFMRPPPRLSYLLNNIIIKTVIGIRLFTLLYPLI